MIRSLALLLIALFFGGGFGFLVAASNGITLDGHDHGDMAAHGGGHGAAGHGAHDMPLDLDPAGPAPELDIELVPDPASGWNLHLRPQAFRFAPEHASGAHVAGEGHAHLYVNGEKRARLYGNWAHIPALPKGEVTIEVVLNSNDHRPLRVAGRQVADQVVLLVE